MTDLEDFGGDRDYDAIVICECKERQNGRYTSEKRKSELFVRKNVTCVGIMKGRSAADQSI